MFLLFIIAMQQLGAQEVFATQSWELTFDQKLDGWVDPGDRILVTTEISTYDSLSHDITFTNLKISCILTLARVRLICKKCQYMPLNFL